MAQIISPNFFTPRLSKYNLRGSGLNVLPPPYNSLVRHSSYLYRIAHMWNQFPAVTKSSTTLAQFHKGPVYELYIILSIFTFVTYSWARL